MAKLVDALRSGRSGGNPLGVRLSPCPQNQAKENGSTPKGEPDAVVTTAGRAILNGVLKPTNEHADDQNGRPQKQESNSPHLRQERPDAFRQHFEFGIQPRVNSE